MSHSTFFSNIFNACKSKKEEQQHGSARAKTFTEVPGTTKILSQGTLRTSMGIHQDAVRRPPLDLLTMCISHCAKSLTIHGWSDMSPEFSKVNRARRSHSNLVLSWSICIGGMGIWLLTQNLWGKEGTQQKVKFLMSAFFLLYQKPQQKLILWLKDLHSSAENSRIYSDASRLVIKFRWNGWKVGLELRIHTRAKYTLDW